MRLLLPAILALAASTLFAEPFRLTKAWTKIQFQDCPVAYAHTGGESPQQIVALQRGMVHLLPQDRDGAEATVFLDLRQKLKEEIHFEAGIHGIAFHPDFKKNRRFFISYSESEPRRNVLRAHPETQKSPSKLIKEWSGDRR